MISELSFRGGGAYTVISGGIYTVYKNTPKFLRLSGSPGDKLVMPTASEFSTGTMFLVVNAGANTIGYTDGTDILPGEASFFFNNGSSWIQTVKTPTIYGATTTLSAVLVGGQPTPTQCAEYNFGTATWAARTASPQNRHFGVGFLQGDRWYYTGLFPSDVVNGPITNEFNLATNAWRVMTNCPFNPVRATAAYIPSIGFAFSGDASVAGAKFTGFAWTSLRSCPIPRPRSAAGRRSDLIYWMPGEPVPIAGLEYHPKTDVYITITAAGSTGRYNISCFSENDRVFVCGGKTDPSTAYDLVDEYAPATKTWTTKTVLSMGARHSGGSFQHQGFGYYCSGADGADAPQTNAARFANNAWTAIAASAGVWGVSGQGASQ